MGEASFLSTDDVCGRRCVCTGLTFDGYDAAPGDWWIVEVTGRWPDHRDRNHASHRRMKETAEVELSKPCPSLQRLSEPSSSTPSLTFGQYFVLKNNEQCAIWGRGTLSNKCHFTKTSHRCQPELLSCHQSESEIQLQVISQNWTWKCAATWSRTKTKY